MKSGREGIKGREVEMKAVRAELRPDSMQKDRNPGKQLLIAEIERLMQDAFYMCPTEVRDILAAEYIVSNHYGYGDATGDQTD
ncbi:hypothetical protein NPIL_299471 [Nephila pilipes]|uniref:Uncharacterized protein n=1 Tax=Nephila pilipes TaxID=299642 RepID=A0A8X6MU34_NEPPI|nr:hypothetical protein NPIL_299471 [Nephila pilipes]